MPKRLLSGTVVSSNSNKTIVVKVSRRVKHKMYRKIITRSKNYHAHDENNQFKVGDKVSIMESKPISKLKTWTVIYANGVNEWYKCNLNYLLPTTLEQEKYNASRY